MMSVDEKLAAAIHRAVVRAILGMGMEEFRKTSFFGTNPVHRKGGHKAAALPKARKAA